MAKKHISSQAVGAYGEKIVEAELLRRGWIPSNVNATVKNAVDYDIIAQRENGHRIVTLRVKTCGPKMGAFQFSFRKSEQITPKNLAGNDFTILVQMGETPGVRPIFYHPNPARARRRPQTPECIARKAWRETH